MAGAIPGNVVEVDRFLVVFVAVAAELKRGERCGFADRVGHEMVKRAVERPGGALDRVGDTGLAIELVLLKM